MLDAETHAELRSRLIAASKDAMSYGQRHPEADQFGPEGADVAEGLTNDVMRKVGFETAEEQRERSMARQDRFAKRAQARRAWEALRAAITERALREARIQEQVEAAMVIRPVDGTALAGYVTTALRDDPSTHWQTVLEERAVQDSTPYR